MKPWKARASDVARVFFVTTNNKLHALRIYHRLGFDMVALPRNAVDRATEPKPKTVMVGMKGIPLRHEIGLQLTL